MSMADPIMGQALSIADIAALQGAGSKYGPVVEILSKRNPILRDIRMVSCNNGTSHKAVIRTSLPEGTPRGFNQGINAEKSTVTQIEEPTKMLESLAVADCKLVDLHGPGGLMASLLQQNSAFLMGLGQTQARMLFYGNEAADPLVYNGFAARYNAYGSDDTKSSFNVINGGGTGANLTSIYLISWGDDKAHGIYPANSTGGLRHEDMGIDLIPDSAGRMFRAYRHHYSWDMGLMIKDWRYCIRIANLDVSSFGTWDRRDPSAYTGPPIDDLILQAIKMNFPNSTPENTVMYVPRDVDFLIQKMARDTGNLALNIGQWNGEDIMTVNGIPIRVEESISKHELAVPAAA